MMEKESNKNNKSYIKLFVLLVPTVVLSILILVFVLTILFPDLDAYLLTGVLFGGWCIIIFIILIPLLFSITNKKKDFFKQWLMLISIIIGMMGAYYGYIHLKDIKEEPKTAIMTNAVLKRDGIFADIFGDTFFGDTFYNEYLVGYIDGEETHLKLTRDANSAVSFGENYEMLWIKYWK